MKALVTGAGGFLGGALASRLRALGWEVRGFSRHRYPQLDAAGVEQLQGDLADAGSIGEAVRGCDVVFHVAAKVDAWGRYDDFHRTNVVGTRNVVDACRRGGVARLVFTSTPSVTFAGRDIEGGDESLPYAAVPEAHYPATKAEAERLVLAANDGELRTVALRPHIVWGPGDRHLVPRVIAKARAGRLVRLTGPAKRIDVTYIDDAVQAHVLAADRLSSAAGRVGGRAYFISAGKPVELWWMIDRILECARLPPLSRSISPGVALSLARVLTAAHTLLRLRGEPPLTPWIVKELSTSHWFCIDRARRDLGYSPAVDMAEGFARLRAWLDAHPPGIN